MLTILILINLLRTEPLVLDQDLSSHSQIRAEQLYNDKQWSHDGWKDSFTNTDCSYQGENLSKGFRNIKKEFKAFLNSPTHKANMVNENYDYIGIGSYKNVKVYLFCGKI